MDNQASKSVAYALEWITEQCDCKEDNCCMCSLHQQLSVALDLTKDIEQRYDEVKTFFCDGLKHLNNGITWDIHPCSQFADKLRELKKETDSDGMCNGHYIKIMNKDTNDIYAIYTDTGERTIGNPRPCGACGLDKTKEDHDGCLGTLPGPIMNACCGHGDTACAYIQYENGTRLDGSEAIAEQERLRRHRRRDPKNYHERKRRRRT